MQLIADSGSTKTDWILTDGEKIHSSYDTIGYNPYFIGTEKIVDSLSKSLLPQLNAESINKVYFYGAGCSTHGKVSIVFEALKKYFANAEIYVNHDLLAAARALLGSNRGFAAIIGTGSNTCIYNGKGIEINIDSLGYLLGDEGSGCYIGKKIIRDYMRNAMPEELHKLFLAKYQTLDPSVILDSIYKKPLPNRYLASFCTFAGENIQHEYIKKIVSESFTDFFKYLVSRYPEYEKLSFNCVGSVGFTFKDILTEVATSYNMKVGKIIQSPIDDLVRYHLSKYDDN